MNFKKFIPLAVVFLFQLLACKKSGVGNNNPKTSADTDIYISGFSSKGGAYWKNGTPTYWPGSFGDKNASIAVSGNDVYIAGYSLANGTNGGDVATIWKNGVAKQLDEGADYSQIDNIQMGNIFVNGTDIYAVGDENGPGAGGDADLFVAVYWKNNALIKLTDGSTNASITAIAINNNDVYAAGYVDNSSTRTIATYWKNSVATALPEGTSYTLCTGIAVKGTNVYVTEVGPQCGYWKNNVFVNLVDCYDVANIVIVSK